MEPQAHADGVQDLGYSPVPSPLEILDELFYRTAKGIPADDIAAPHVLAEARALTLRTSKENGIPAIGTLMPPNPSSAGEVPEVCVEFEGYSFALSMARVNGKPYLTAMRQRVDCPDPQGAHTHR